jgi:hypothetical protein
VRAEAVVVSLMSQMTWPKSFGPTGGTAAGLRVPLGCS